MNEQKLKETCARMTNPPKGLIAIDESSKTCNKRFEALGIETTEENRRKYRELLITAPKIEDYISGYILYDETIRQKTTDGRSFVSALQEKGIEVGIKVDEGLKDFSPGSTEKLTQGIEGLPPRMKEYREMGATFAKWRSVINIGPGIPTDEFLIESAKIFAEYCNICQSEDIVPIIEPEVLIDGGHSIEECFEVTSRNLDIVFRVLKEENVFIPGIILKTSMVIPGKDGQKVSPEKVAEMTIKCLKAHVPEDIGGVVFLSGGQSEEESTVHLNLMHQLGELPWNLSFSYSRAIQNPVLKHWAEHRDDVAGAQAILLQMAKNNSLATQGQYK